MRLLMPRLKLFSAFKVDLLIYTIIAAHIATTYATNKAIGSKHSFDITDTFSIFGLLSCVYVALLPIGICIKYILNALKGINNNSLEGVKTYKAFNPNNITGAGLFLGVGLLLGSYRDFKKMMPEISPFTWDVTFANLDRMIHRADPWQYLTLLNRYYEPILWTYATVWHFAHALLTLSICVTQAKIRTRYLLTYVSTWIVAGNLVPLFFMAVGPIFYERLTGDDRFTGLSDRLYSLADPSLPASLIPDRLWQSYVSHSNFVGGGISAFPSLHVAMSMLLFLAAKSYGNLAGGVAFAFLIFTMLASVHLGWHYAVDGYASILIVWGLWHFWSWVEERHLNKEPLTA